MRFRPGSTTGIPRSRRISQAYWTSAAFVLDGDYSRMGADLVLPSCSKKSYCECSFDQDCGHPGTCKTVVGTKTERKWHANSDFHSTNKLADDADASQGHKDSLAAARIAT